MSQKIFLNYDKNVKNIREKLKKKKYSEIIEKKF